MCHTSKADLRTPDTQGVGFGAVLPFVSCQVVAFLGYIEFDFRSGVTRSNEGHTVAYAD